MTIMLEGKNFNVTENHLPTLIHGEDHQGASLYTISFAANLCTQGLKLVALSGYPMALEEFQKQVGDLGDKAIFYTKDKVAEFLSHIEKINGEIVLLKNVDLFNEDVFNQVSKAKKYIISGDISKCIFKEKILAKNFSTKVFFSKLDEVELPALNKYEGFLMSGGVEGITKLES